MIIKNRIKTLILLMFFLIIIANCTTKKNLVGTPDSNTEPRELILTDSLIIDYYSFEDSIANYNSNTTLNVGNYLGNQAFTLLRFSNFPDSVETITRSIELILKSKKAEDFDPQNLLFGKISENWYEDDATWFAATDSTEWSSEGYFFDVLEGFEVFAEDDSINVSVPENLVREWIESDSTNFGLVIYSNEADGFLELNSSESGFGATLTFDYQLSSGDSLITYSEGTTSDTFIFFSDDDFQKFEEELKLSNIQPTKMFIKFDVNEALFFNLENSGIDNSDDFRRMTINRAEMILSNKDEDYYLSDGRIHTRPYIVLNDYPEIPFVYGDDYEYVMSSTSDSLDAGKYAIDITEIIRDITSGEKENFGILLKSIYENKDYSHLDFATKNDIDPARRPFIKIIYTPPYLDD
ncbi:MAG: DNRLRE domain-containing protein [Candidatus Cloacimonetes bacterium]|nr:DNRLRE domain-containing protein [Candidatus Cloacimonadota bacterium]